MKDQRILAFNRSRQLSAEELEKVSAAGLCSHVCAGGSYDYQGLDTSIDIVVDL